MKKILFALLALPFAASAQTHYTIQDLGAAPNPGGYPQGRGYALNDSGLVVGTSVVQNPLGNTYPFRFDGGPSALPTPNGSTYGFANGVNDSGAIVGYASPSGGNTRAFVTVGSTTQELGSLTGSQFSYGYGIDASGAVAGYYNGGASGVTRGFTWSPTTNAFTELGTIVGTASSRGVAYALNDAGVAVGNSDSNSAGLRHATVYNPNGSLLDLGAIAATQGYGSVSLSSTAYAIDSKGAVVGSFGTSTSASSAFLYDTVSGTFRSLGVPTGKTSATAYGVNGSGVVVGTASGGGSSAFVADANGIYSLFGLVDNSSALGFTSLVEARGINASGQITGWGNVLQPDGSTLYHAYLLTPVATPEPAPLAALGLGALVLMRRRRRV